MMEALGEFGLMPSEEAERKGLQEMDPYELRAEALDRPLEPFELGRALFHLNQRRGFKSNRKAGNEDESEKNKISERIGDLRRDIEESGARTLGEFLWQRHENRESVRARPEWGRYPDRAMYKDEFDKIREAQERHQKLSPEQWDRLGDEIIFYQRDLEPVVPGWCQFEYENEERRAAKALPVFQRFRILTEINNLKYSVRNGREQELTEDERQRVLKMLCSGKDWNFQKGKEDRPAPLPRELRLPSGAVFNLARGSRKKIQGDGTTARLLTWKNKGEKAQELFGKHWFDISLDERNEIVKYLLKTENPECVQQKAIKEWGLSEEQAKAVANVSLPKGYGDLSEKAIRKLLPYLEQGRIYSDAVQDAGYGHHSDFRNEEAHDRLPYYGEVLERDVVEGNPKKDIEKDGEVAHYGRFPNPTVHIGLNQLRRVVNRLIEVYGKPEHIVVELARELKMNKEAKGKLQTEQREGGERNKRFTEMLQSAGKEVTADVLRKLRLWEEQGPPQARKCPYTGKTLSFDMVIDEQTEVDHILPISKTLDNSVANMVVCVASANRFKGGRSPYDAFGHNPGEYDYQGILDRTANFPDNKKWRFREDAMERFEDEDGFLGRQLNETQYLSRTARTYLAYLYDEKNEGQRVRAAPGRMTALLRRGWGLEGMKGKGTGKQRDDHRHHAIDAFVLACIDQGLVQKFQRAAGANYNAHKVDERLEAIAKEAKPWDDFHWNQVKSHWDRIVVSHKPDHGTPGVKGQTTGQLHKETAYGLVKLSEKGPSEVVVRKKLQDVRKREELQAVRDETMRGALLKLWDEVAVEGGEAGSFAERAASEGVKLPDGSHQTVRRVRVLDKQTVIPIKRGKEHPETGKAYKGYKLDSNEFADIWQMRDGSWKIVVVPTFDANQREFNIEDFRPVTSRGKYRGKPDPIAKPIMRLYKDDMAALGEGLDSVIVRIRKFSAGTVVLDAQSEANVDARERKGEIDRNKNIYSAKRLYEQKFRRIHVDEIGRVRDPGPRKS